MTTWVLVTLSGKGPPARAAAPGTDVSAVTPGLACRLRAAPELPAGEGALLACLLYTSDAADEVCRV